MSVTFEITTAAADSLNGTFQVTNGSPLPAVEIVSRDAAGAALVAWSPLGRGAADYTLPPSMRDYDVPLPFAPGFTGTAEKYDLYFTTQNPDLIRANDLFGIAPASVADLQHAEISVGQTGAITLIPDQ